MAYIRRARSAGYAVIVTNTNLNDYESPRLLRRHATHSIRVKHCLVFFIWIKIKLFFRVVLLLKNMDVMFGNILFVQVMRNMFVLWLIPMAVLLCLQWFERFAFLFRRKVCFRLGSSVSERIWSTCFCSSINWFTNDCLRTKNE